jgi:tyrosyl-tRNA synthetase
MSKSLKNYIGINESPEQMFGKVMSISDDLMWRYFDLLSFQPIAKLKDWKGEVEKGANPRDVKFRLAEEIVERFHDRTSANRARDAFIAQFQRGALPEKLPEIKLIAPSGELPIANVLKESGLVSSTSEGIRMIKQGAVRIDGERTEDRNLKIKSGTTLVCQVGKRRYARVSID